MRHQTDSFLSLDAFSSLCISCTEPFLPRKMPPCHKAYPSGVQGTRAPPWMNVNTTQLWTLSKLFLILRGTCRPNRLSQRHGNCLASGNELLVSRGIGTHSPTWDFQHSQLLLIFIMQGKRNKEKMRTCTRQAT